MKKTILFLVTLLISFSSFSQNSWFNLEVQFDQWASDESFVLFTQNGDTLVNYQPTVPYEFYETMVFADSGDVAISLYDSYGDGWIDAANTPANILIENDCQGVILDLDATFAFTQFDTIVNLLPCPPPVSGCTNPNSTNYDSLATIDDGSCLFPVEFVLDMNTYPDTFSTPYVSGTFNNWTDSMPMIDPDGNNIWEATLELPQGQYLWKFMLDNWADQELPQLGPNSACFQPDGNGFINRTLDVNDTAINLPPVCWESCLPCGAVLGCMDPTSANFNPWANIDDGSCITLPSCPSGQTPIAIVVTPDNYGGELSWKLYGDSGLVAEAPTGTYSGAQPGLPISTFVCVDTNQLYDLVVEDSYGDGLCGTCFGGTTDGNVVVLDCDENILYNLQDDFPDGNFNYLTTSPQFEPAVCEADTPIPGCTNPFYLEYDSLATVHVGIACGTPRVEGCTDSTAFNYDPNANTSEIMEGQYTLEIFDGAADGWGGTWLGLQQGNWISPQYKMGANDGTSISFQVNLNIYQPVQAYVFVTPNSVNSIDQIAYKLTGPEGDVIIDVGYWDAIPFPYIQEADSLPTFGDVCIPVIEGCMDSTSLNYIQPTGDPLVDVNTDDGSCIPIVVGCMNSLAFNYDPNANVDDPSMCIPVVVGCMDSTAFNYDPTANTPGTCVPIVNGCTDPTSFNYDPNANVDDGSCVPVITGCTDPTAFNYDSLANTDDGSCIATVLGCTDPQSFNYDPLANTDDGSCIPVVYGCTDPSSFNYNPNANTDNGSCVPVVYGCLDSTAFNFDPLANTDNGTCIPFIYGCTDNTALNYDPTANTDDGSCIPILAGCTDSTAFNYNPLANTDDGSCIPIVYGCTDPSAFNYDPNANTEDFSCIPVVYGCMDSTAVNYDPNANVDNGTCITAIVGCTDPNAYNFDPTANVSDSTACFYDAGCVTGPGNPYWLNDQCYAWVIDVDNYCCNNDWDPTCQEMYNYCEQGWPVGIDIWEYSRALNNIVVFPNPAKDILNISVGGLLDVKYSLYDFTGKLLVEGEDDGEINMSQYSSGVYFLNIDYNGNTYNKKIVKE